MEKSKEFYKYRRSFFDGAKWKEDSEIGKAFMSARVYFLKEYKDNINKENIAYEMAMAAVINEYNIGVMLNKKVDNFNLKPIIIIKSKDHRNPKKISYIQDCL